MTKKQESEKSVRAIIVLKHTDSNGTEKSRVVFRKVTIGQSGKATFEYRGAKHACDVLKERLALPLLWECAMKSSKPAKARKPKSPKKTSAKPKKENSNEIASDSKTTTA